MPTYLSYLRSRFEIAGGEIHVRRLDSLDAAPDGVDVVVNCPGVGARELVPDDTVTAIRGQLVSIKNPGVLDFFSEDTGESSQLLHYLPHGETMILGGVALEGDWNTQADLDVATAIIERCSAVCPPIRTAEVLADRVGLRPTRPLVRVETETTGRHRIVHNYGHGGAGVSLSWGCAEEVAGLAAVSAPADP